MSLQGALHGEFVVQLQDGTTQTRRLQSGDVTAVSADSLSVTSTDGFSATYVIGSGADVSAVAVGDTVRVLATVDGTTVTATAVVADSNGAQGMPGQQDGGLPGGAGGLTPPGDAGAAPQTS
jgi:hypothetical protein